MFSFGSSHRYHLYDGHSDMRKSFDGLCGLVASGMGRRPTGGEVFVFLNRRRTHIKLLHWEDGGFVLYHKRLERVTFALFKRITGELSWSDPVLIDKGIPGSGLLAMLTDKYMDHLPPLPPEAAPGSGQYKYPVLDDRGMGQTGNGKIGAII